MTDVTGYEKRNKLINNRIIVHGVLSGVVAGVIFALAEMIAAASMQSSVLAPLKMIASIPLGVEPQAISANEALLSGGIFHIVFAAFLGLLAVLIIKFLNITHRRIILMSTFYGFAIWLANFYVFAPLLNAPWFTANTNALQQFAWHTFMFGSVLGIYLHLTAFRPVKQST